MARRVGGLVAKNHEARRVDRTFANRCNPAKTLLFEFLFVQYLDGQGGVFGKLLDFGHKRHGVQHVRRRGDEVAHRKHGLALGHNSGDALLGEFSHQCDTRRRVFLVRRYLVCSIRAKNGALQNGFVLGRVFVRECKHETLWLLHALSGESGDCPQGVGCRGFFAHPHQDDPFRGEPGRSGHAPRGIHPAFCTDCNRGVCEQR